MGSDLVVSIVMPSAELARREYERAKSLGDNYEQRFSRFLPTSELSRLNESRNANVSPEFMDVISTGFDLYRATNGVFNPLVQIARLGYDVSFDSLNGPKKANKDSYDVQLSSIHIDETTQHITLAEGQRLDVGGFLKGMVAERMAKSIQGASGIIVNIGGDIYTIGKDENGAPFGFDVYDPINEQVAVVVPLNDGAIATSGVYRRNWEADGRKVHHILDTTGTENPKSNLVSATIIAEHGHEADAYATVAIVLGSEKAEHLLKQRGLSYVLITQEGKTIINI
ncbi:MAG: FAD:protein transferase [Patescibacteria group bacterium]|nr:FAD:protein transferase [Patescibacteria group bacterium]